MTWRKWRKRILEFEAEDAHRYLNAPLWFSIRPEQPWSVVPVFGGTHIGWEALLLTLGTSMLASGNNLTIANLSEWHVTASLAELASIFRDGPSVHPAGRFGFLAVARMPVARLSRRVGAGFHVSGEGQLLAGIGHRRWSARVRQGL
ncbi:hypothetical protein F7Q99_28510 [Streptomyces kaniharaensis]|uniref:Uncharacterized protein n=1 Tax=Streptomyces kaniharaensis TaxID=212423 RepID=A0A6N7L088_9ACTN|nr:hypothetical protein [Streptomyces kaniharaensis]MQS16077.1 hypothetical protein [Streptomyces kaniharaensis]